MFAHSRNAVQRCIDEVIYSAYILKTTSPRIFLSLLSHAALESKRTRYAELKRVAHSYIAYHTHPLDYFYFRLYRSPIGAGQHYANTWDMHQFHRKYNNPAETKVLRDKYVFRKEMSDFTAGEFVSLCEPGAMDWVASRQGRKVVAKSPLGDSGSSVSVHEISVVDGELRIDNRPASSILGELRKLGRTLIEDYLEQHPVLAAFHPESLNTVRFITFINGGGAVEIWAALVRLGNGSSVDNFGAGGLAAEVNVETGEILGPLLTKDPFALELESLHPITGTPVVGVFLPYWKESIDLVCRASHRNPEVRTVGWDVAILGSGPVILEGNDNWGKMMVQPCSSTPIGNRIRELL